MRDTDRFDFPALDLTPRDADMYDAELHIEPVTPSMDHALAQTADLFVPDLWELAPPVDLVLDILQGVGVVTEVSFVMVDVVIDLAGGTEEDKEIIAYANGALSWRGAFEYARVGLVNAFGLKSDAVRDAERMRSPEFEKMYKEDFFDLHYRERFAAIGAPLAAPAEARPAPSDFDKDHTDRFGRGGYVGDDPRETTRSNDDGLINA